MKYTILIILFFISGAISAEENQKEKDCVVLIHGFLKSSDQFRNLGNYLEKNELIVYYVDFPSRSNDVQNVSKSYVSPIVKSACVNRVTKVHFVTHSAGGIILRYFLKENKLPNLGRVVMLSPPNMGSEVADFLTDFSFLNFLFGPMLFQLRTEKSSFVNMIGLPNFEYGVIMGNSSYDFISSLIIPGDDDGKVSIERSKLANTKEFMLVNRTHTFIMDGPEVQRATFRFIQSGKFE